MIGKILRQWSNLIFVPIALLILVILGVIGETSKLVNEVTGLPFFSSVAVAIVGLFILGLALVSAYVFLRSFIVWLIKRSVPHAGNPPTD